MERSFLFSFINAKMHANTCAKQKFARRQFVLKKIIWIIIPISSASFSDFRPGLRFSEVFSLSWLTNATVNTLISYKV